MLTSFSALADDPKIGVDFDKTANIVPTGMPDKIVVTEIFSYGCKKCYQMNPKLEAWRKKLPSDVVFRRIPYSMGDHFRLAQGYFVMEDFGLTEKLHNLVYEYIHNSLHIDPKIDKAHRRWSGNDSNYLDAKDDKALVRWISMFGGIDEIKIKSDYHSIETRNKLHEAMTFIDATGVAIVGLPGIIVDGQYIVPADDERYLKVIDYVVANIRADRARAAAAK